MSFSMRTQRSLSLRAAICLEVTSKAERETKLPGALIMVVAAPRLSAFERGCANLASETAFPQAWKRPCKTVRKYHRRVGRLSGSLCCSGQESNCFRGTGWMCQWTSDHRSREASTCECGQAVTCAPQFVLARGSDADSSLAFALKF